jgi:hypothetical protein
MHLRLRQVQHLLLLPRPRRVLALACLGAPQIVRCLGQLLLCRLKLPLKLGNHFLVLELGGKFC